MSRPHRLVGISYNRLASYFVTTCTSNRRKAFLDLDFARESVIALLAFADKDRFVVPAYCLMPDHAHVLLTAAEDGAPLLKLVREWKQSTGYRWRRTYGTRLWQEGYFERVLRGDEPQISVARYIVENPVRAGLVRRVEDDPLVGSSCYRLAEIVEAVQLEGWPRRLRRS
jgi:REP element-mobilizing transposase RayT